MYYTNEYTVLKSVNGKEDIILKPGLANAFMAIDGEYKPTSSAYLIDVDTKKIVVALDVSTVFKGIGNEPAPRKTTPKPKESLIEPEDG